MAATTSQADLKVPTLEPGSSVVQVTVTYAATDTTGTHTFTRAFRDTPDVVGIARVDAIASAVVERIEAVSATAITLTLSAAATGLESYRITLVGRY